MTRIASNDDRPMVLLAAGKKKSPFLPCQLIHKKAIWQRQFRGIRQSTAQRLIRISDCSLAMQLLLDPWKTIDDGEEEKFREIVNYLNHTDQNQLNFKSNITFLPR
jgi:hypothetical protein